MAERLRAEHFGEEALREMRARWADGHTVAVRLPVSIRRKRAAAEHGEVQLYVRREQNADYAKETYVRGRVTVSMRAMAERANCIALLVADDGIASTFLGDAEPPAHDQWLRNRLKEYSKPEEALNRIKYGLRDLLQIVENAEDDQPIKDAFTEYMWTDRPEQEGDAPPKPVPRGPITPIPLPVPSPHVLQRIPGGFAYAYRPRDGVVSNLARISVSYRRRTASKKSKKARFADFDSAMPLDEEGIATLEQEVEPRRVVFNLTNIGPEYRLAVTGFDQNRDIELRLEADT